MKSKEKSKAISVKKDGRQAKTEKGQISKLSVDDLAGLFGGQPCAGGARR